MAEFKTDDLTDAEERMLAALASMAMQYLDRGGVLDHSSMHAGEAAMEVLCDYGLINAKTPGATWTSSGQAFLDSH